MGVMWEFGQGVDQSSSMAMRWYAKAAAQGVEQAQAQIDAIFAKRRCSALSAAVAAPPSAASDGQKERPTNKGKKKKAGKKKRSEHIPACMLRGMLRLAGLLRMLQ